MTEVAPFLPVVAVRSLEGISLSRTIVTASPAAVRGGLVRNLPGAVDPDQVVKIDPPATRFLRVKAELDCSRISNLSDRDESTHDTPTGWRRPSLEVLGDQMLVKIATGVDIEDPGVFVKGFPELANVIVVKCINVEPHNSNDRVVFICPRGHGVLRLLILTVDDASLRMEQCPQPKPVLGDWLLRGMPATHADKAERHVRPCQRT